MKTLFQISQIGVQGKITENSGYKKKIYIQKNEQKFSTIIKDFKNGEYVDSLPLREFYGNPGYLYAIKINLQNNQQDSYNFKINQNTFFQNFNRVINDLNDDNYILCLYYEKKKDESYQITRELYDYLVSLGQNQFYPVDSEMNPYFGFCGIIHKGKFVSQQCSFIQNTFDLEFLLNTKNDIGQSDFGKNLIPDDKVNFQTRKEQEIICEFPTPNIKFLHLSGMIKKNMNVLSGHPDQIFTIQYLNDQNNVLNSHDCQMKSAYTFQDIELYQLVNKQSTKVKVIMQCKNALTVPGDLEIRNLQLFESTGKFDHQLTDANYDNNNFLTAISEAGIQTNQYNESIGFNPRNFIEYKQEYNQETNLYKEKSLPVVVEEPVKIFNEIIDNNQLRSVIKQTNNTHSLTLPQINVNPNQSYIFGMWVNTKNNQNIKLQVQCQQKTRTLNGTDIPIDNQILLDEQNITNQFFYGFVYPYGLRKYSTQQTQELLAKIDQQLSEIQANHSNEQKRGIICLEKTDFIFTPTISFTQEQQVSGTIVMPIFKELQIAQFRRDQITALNLEERTF